MCETVKDNSDIPLSAKPKINKTNQFYYYDNFILVSENAVNSLSNYIKLITPQECLFKEKMVFIFDKNNNNIQIFEMNNKKYIQKFAFIFHKNEYLLKCVELLKENGFEDFKKYYLMFKDDYSSPIFNQDNKEIGYAYLYNPQIQDYSNYLINKKLIAFVKLYFNYAKIHSNNNEGRNGKYILVNIELINACKMYYNYPQIEQKLKNNDLTKQIISSIEGEWNDFNNILNDKKISIIIKNYLSDINQQFNSSIFQNDYKNNNINEEPEYQAIQGNSYFYYNNFELIDEDIYTIIFNNVNYSKNGNYRECYFENSYMYFNLPGYLCNDKRPRNIEICSLNQNNFFIASFLIEYNISNGFQTIIESAKLNGGFDIWLKNFKFNNSIEQLLDNKGKPIGLIYNLMYKPENSNIQKNNNKNNFSNNNFINNNQIINNNSNKNINQNNNIINL